MAYPPHIGDSFYDQIPHFGQLQGGEDAGFFMSPPTSPSQHTHLPELDQIEIMDDVDTINMNDLRNSDFESLMPPNTIQNYESLIKTTTNTRATQKQAKAKRTRSRSNSSDQQSRNHDASSSTDSSLIQKKILPNRSKKQPSSSWIDVDKSKEIDQENSNPVYDQSDANNIELSDDEEDTEELVQPSRRRRSRDEVINHPDDIQPSPPKQPMQAESHRESTSHHAIDQQSYDQNNSTQVLSEEAQKRLTMPIDHGPLHATHQPTAAMDANFLNHASTQIPPNVAKKSIYYTLCSEMYNMSGPIIKALMPWHLPMCHLVDDLKNLSLPPLRPVEVVIQKRQELTPLQRLSCYPSLDIPDFTDDTSKNNCRLACMNRFENAHNNSWDMYLYAVDAIGMLMINMTPEEKKIYTPTIHANYAPRYSSFQVMTCPINLEMPQKSIATFMIHAMVTLQTLVPSIVDALATEEFVYMYHPIVNQVGLFIPRRLFNRYFTLYKDDRSAMIERTFFIHFS